MREMAPNPLLVKYSTLLLDETLDGPVLDLACGEGENGLYVAGLGLPVILADRSPEALQVVRQKAEGRGLDVKVWEVDLEGGSNPLESGYYRGILVFRYLHRPLIPFIRDAVRKQGILIYETFTVDQPKYGHPHNPEYLLRPGELADWFRDWRVIHYFEGLLEKPPRAMAQIVCRKPSGPEVKGVRVSEASGSYGNRATSESGKAGQTVKEVDLNKTLYDLTEEYPELIPVLVELGFAGVAFPEMRESHGKVMTILSGYEKLGVDLARVKNRLEELGYVVKQ